jgi:site-specific recombinase XerD
MKLNIVLPTASFVSLTPRHAHTYVCRLAVLGPRPDFLGRGPGEVGVSQSRSSLRLAALRHLFDWLMTGQVMPANPARSVRGPAHVVKVGKTPVLAPKE